MNTPVWRLRWRVAASRRRLLAWNVLVPVIVLLPVALSSAAAPHRAAVIGVFITFFGTFGSCIPLVRDRQRGWSEKVRLTGYGPRRWLSERTAAETSLDLIELAPVLIVTYLAVGSGAGSFVSALPAVALALLAANLLGSLVAAFVASIAEAALACGAAALFALHFSGLFRSATPDTWAWHLERTGPFRPLVGALRDGLSGGGHAGPEMVPWAGSLVAVAALALLVLSVAPRLTRRVPGGT